MKSRHPASAHISFFKLIVNCGIKLSCHDVISVADNVKLLLQRTTVWLWCFDLDRISTLCCFMYNDTHLIHPPCFTKPHLV